MQFNLVNNKDMLVFLCVYVHNGVVCLVVRGFTRTCTGPHAVFFLFFCFPPSTSLFFPTVITVWWVPGRPCVGAHGWVAGIASRGRILSSQSGGWLITLEAPAPGHSCTHLPLQLDTGVNDYYYYH